MSKDALREQGNVSLTIQYTTMGDLLDGTDFKILLGSGAAKSFMPK